MVGLDVKCWLDDVYWDIEKKMRDWLKKSMRKNYNLMYLGYEFFIVNYVLRFFYIDYFYKL